MWQFPAKCLFIAFFIFGCFKVSAQTTASSGTNTSNPNNGRENNPYSKYGIGELWNGNNTVLRGMGNITSAFENPYEVNSDNPASYSFLQRTTFEAGAMGSSRTILANGLSYNTGTATLAYLNLGIPVTKNSGLCIGFRPYARSYYSLVDTINNSPIGQAARSYSGEGSLNYAYIGAAAKYKGLSVGFNFGYMFGTLTNGSDVVPIDTAATNRAFSTGFINSNRIGGLYWKGGLMYERKIDSDYTFRIGGTITIKQDITERLNSYQISAYNFGDTLINDTASMTQSQRGKLTLPTTYSIGAMFGKENKWDIGVDYTATQWSQFNSTPDASLMAGVGSSSYKISAGGEYIPDINSIHSYLSRVTYRMGFYYGTDYLYLNNNSIPYYGITLGGSLPFRRSLSHLHLALDIGREGMTTNNLIQETYVRFTIGISFNDKWFIPRKYD